MGSWRAGCGASRTPGSGGGPGKRNGRKRRHRAPGRPHLATKALETVRRQVWQQLRQFPDKDAARRFKGARWALLKNPEDLSDEQAVTLRQLRRKGGALWRAYALKEALRAVFAGDLSEAEVGMLLDRFCSKASRSGLKPFVTLAQTLRNDDPGSWLPSGSGSTTPDTKDSTGASGSSSTAPTDSTPQTPPSP